MIIFWKYTYYRTCLITAYKCYFVYKLMTDIILALHCETSIVYVCITLKCTFEALKFLGHWGQRRDSLSKSFRIALLKPICRSPGRWHTLPPSVLPLIHSLQWNSINIGIFVTFFRFAMFIKIFVQWQHICITNSHRDILRVKFISTQKYLNIHP